MRWVLVAALNIGLVWAMDGLAQEAETDAPTTELPIEGRANAISDGVVKDQAGPDVETVPRRSFPDDPFYHTEGSWEQDFADQWALRDLRVYTDVALSFGHGRREALRVVDPVPSAQLIDQPESAGAVLVDTPDGPALVFLDPPAIEPVVTTDTVAAEAPVIVAVIDTGVDYLHADFGADHLWRNPNEKRNGRDDDDNGFVDDLIGWNFVDNSNNPWDRSGHGTHIIGIITACTDNGLGISAINPDAVVMPLKVGNFVGQARSSAIAGAIYYAVDNGARIINLSLGGEVVTQAERLASQYAADNDVLIVVSAGNKGFKASSFGYPSLPDVLVVGASNTSGERAGFSNFGAEVALLAPGVDVLSLRARDTDFIALSDPPDYPEGSAVVGDDENYYRASGTSFAAAIVTGVASRLMTLRPELTTNQVRRMLVHNAIDVGVPGVDQRSGYGRVDLVRALGADPEVFIEAQISKVDLQLLDEQVLLKIMGTANADNFASARMEVIPWNNTDQVQSNETLPEAEAAWQRLGSALTQPVTNGQLAEMNLETLILMTGGARSWQVRVVVEHANGEFRESRMALALPEPPAYLRGTR
ncbi:MAG: S8 family serine peptidase [Gammaproteobacteria bacterium]|nr:S8 family serine peptidase [Gammaproteobacteria bacterium]